MFRKAVAAASLITSTLVLAPTVASAGSQVGSYIVVLKPGTPAASTAASMTRQYGGRLGFVYSHAIRGFSVTISAAGAQAMAHNSHVSFVEADREVHLEAQTTPTGITRMYASQNASIDIDGTDDKRVDVDVAVIDTGIDRQQPELNVVDGINCAQGSPMSAKCSGDGDDDHYHGTHVAGTIAALDNGDGVVGVAPGARLYAVKVLNSQGSGYTSWIVAGIDWVTARASTIEVANMSLGGSGYSAAEYNAIQGAVNAGVAFAVAAGNSSADASGFSPGGFDNVLSVSALADFDGIPGGLGSPTCRSDVDDTLASFSNWGSQVDIAAPGVCILSTYPIEKGSYGTISGTSMASPHVAGALALMASSSNPNNSSDVYALYSTLVSKGNLNWTDDSGDGIKERLLDVSTITPTLVSTTPTNATPVASFTQSCTSLTCTFNDTSTDSDGTIASRLWTIGGNTYTTSSVTYTWGAAGTYNVTLQVTDNGGATASTTKAVKVGTTKKR